MQGFPIADFSGGGLSPPNGGAIIFSVGGDRWGGDKHLMGGGRTTTANLLEFTYFRTEYSAWNGTWNATFKLIKSKCTFLPSQSGKNNMCTDLLQEF